MNSLWTAILFKAIQVIMSKDWNSVMDQVSKLLTSDKTGAEKRQIVFDTLRSVGVSCATWLLYAAIELAYGKLKSEA